MSKSSYIIMSDTYQTRIPIHLDIIKKLDGFITNSRIPHLLFHGSSGTGKYIFNSTSAIQVPTGTTAERPTASEGVIRFNTQTGKYEVSQDGSTWTNLKTDQAEAEITKDVITGDGSTTAFTTMTKSPSDAKNVIVYMDGVMQEATQNYSISGSTLTFSEAPHATARIVVMHGFAEEPVA